MATRKNTLLAVIKREAERIRHNRAYRFMLFAGPLSGILLLFFIFRSGNVRELPLAFVNKDNSILSVKLKNAINASPDVTFTVQMPDIYQAEKYLEQGLVDGIVLIPADTEKKVYSGQSAPIPLYINGTNVLKASLIQRSVLKTVKTVSAGIQVKKLMLQEKSAKEAITRAMPINIQKHVLFNPYTNYNYYLGSALLYIMLFLFAILSSTYTLGNELKRGTGIDLLQTANGSVRMAVLGKLLPYTVIFSGFAMLINLLMYKIEGMPVNGSYTLLTAGQFVALISYQLMGLIFIGATANLRLALSLVSAYSMMAITFSGLTFPLEYMPKAARIFGTIFPFTWWEKLLVSQSLRGAPLSEALPYVGYLLIFQFAALAFLKPYKKSLSDPSRWGKS